MPRPLIPPPVWALGAGAAMWGLNRALPLASLLPRPWNRVGLGIGAIGFIIDLVALMGFRRADTTINPLHPSKATALVTAGLYRYTRNPMYVGLLLLLCGWAAWLGTLSPWVMPLLFAIVITVAQIRPEERALYALFGADYERYCRQVPRWIGVRRGSSGP
ncbi:MAG: isoprenylcysteine carboxylmethyltransferase family protein [Steroidobacteraceae bacterium]